MLGSRDLARGRPRGEYGSGASNPISLGRAASVAVDSNAKDFYSSGLQPAKEYDSQEKTVDGLGHEGQQDRGNTD